MKALVIFHQFNVGCGNGHESESELSLDSFNVSNVM